MPVLFRLFCSNMHFNENSQRKQAKTKNGEDRWAVIYPKVHQGEKSIAKKIKEEATYSKCIKLGYNNIRQSFCLTLTVINIVE